MLSTSITWIMSMFTTCYVWFVSLLNGMQPGGFSFFLSVFLGLYVINRFIDLVVMRFLYSPSSIDRGLSSDSSKAGRAKLKGSSGKGK